MWIACGLAFATTARAAQGTALSPVRGGVVSRSGRLSFGSGGTGTATPGARSIPLRSPSTKRLDRVKRRLAEHLAETGSAPPALSPSPRATIFNGLDKPGMAAGLFSPTPPDTTGAIGPSNYVEFVNGTGITAYDRNLNPLSGPVSLEDFIGFPTDEVFDPQIQWDQSWGRWIYAMDDVEGSNNFLAFGWSKTADPTNLSTEAAGGWCGYFIFTGALFDDYPKLGHSDSGLTIGTNVFTTFFLGSRLWSIAKPANPGSCPGGESLSVGSTGALHTEDGNLAFTPVPANTADSSSNSYVVAADFPEAEPAHQIMAWHLSGAGESATLVADGNMNVAPYDFPANVPQPGTPQVIDSMDTRLTNAVAVTDPAVGQEAVWTQHTVNGTGGRSEVRWYELLPSSKTVRQEGTISDPSQFVFNAAISPTVQGNAAAIDFNRGSASLFPDMHARSRDPGVPSGGMVNDVLLGTSAGPAVDFSCNVGGGEPCRWGDYAGASPDPAVPGVVWGSNQGLDTPSEANARWTTRNFALIADEAAPAAPTISGTDPSSPADDNNPKVKGGAEAGSTVRVYESSDCTGAVAGEGGADTFASPGISVSVAENTTVPLTATATDAVGNTSPCSAAASYTESTPVIPSAAFAAARARVKRGKALLRLRCLGPTTCSGGLRLVVKVRIRAHRRHARARFRRVVIGTASISIPAGTSRIVRVPLTGTGKRLLRRAGRRGLKVEVMGSGVHNRAVRLELAVRRRH